MFISKIRPEGSRGSGHSSHDSQRTRLSKLDDAGTPWLLTLQELHDQRDQVQDLTGRHMVVARGRAHDQNMLYLQALKLTYF